MAYAGEGNGDEPGIGRPPQDEPCDQSDVFSGYGRIRAGTLDAREATRDVLRHHPFFVDLHHPDLNP